MGQHSDWGALAPPIYTLKKALGVVILMLLFWCFILLRLSQTFPKSHGQQFFHPGQTRVKDKKVIKCKVEKRS